MLKFFPSRRNTEETGEGRAVLKQNIMWIIYGEQIERRTDRRQFRWRDREGRRITMC